MKIRNLVKNYPVLQVRSWICGGQGSANIFLTSPAQYNHMFDVVTRYERAVTVSVKVSESPDEGDSSGNIVVDHAEE